MRELLLAGRIIDPVSGCWFGPWKHSTKGYVYMRGSLLHRIAYEEFVGPIPLGMTLDHTCHKPSECMLGAKCPHRSCFNPDHLEPVTSAENKRRGGSGPALNARKTKCIKGHEDFVPMPGRPNERRCRRCHCDRQLRYQKAKTKQHKPRSEQQFKEPAKRKA